MKWPLRVPCCQCMLLIRDHMSQLSLIHSVRSRLVASGHNSAVGSSAEEISHHFITYFNQPDSFSDILLGGIHPRNHSNTAGHLLNSTGSKSTTVDQVEDFFFIHMETNQASKTLENNLLHHLFKVKCVKITEDIY